MKSVLIEFTGTLFFLYVILATGSPIAIGAALALAIYIGGGNYNPAVTIMMISANKQSMDTALLFLIEMNP